MRVAIRNSPLLPTNADVESAVRAHAVDGLDFISVGALTHSAPALDLSLILEPLS